MSNSDEPQQERNVAPPSNQGVRPVKSEGGKFDSELQEQTIQITYSEYRQLLFSGPIPPPQILIQYNDAHPGLADRIVRMAEKQEEHRIDLEKRAITGEIARSREASRLGFILGLVIVVGAIILLAIGRSIEGFGALLPAAGVFIGAYIYGTNKRGKERMDKAKLMAQAAMPVPEPEKKAQ